MEKQQRTPVKLSREQRLTIKKAAEYAGITMTAYIRQAALKEARRDILHVEAASAGANPTANHKNPAP
jgi:uncharacterized protein (DUF1778 family)